MRGLSSSRISVLLFSNEAWFAGRDFTQFSAAHRGRKLFQIRTGVDIMPHCLWRHTLEKRKYAS
jgi:hypothetical protein